MLAKGANNPASGHSCASHSKQAHARSTSILEKTNIVRVYKRLKVAMLCSHTPSFYAVYEGTVVLQIAFEIQHDGNVIRGPVAVVAASSISLDISIVERDDRHAPLMAYLARLCFICDTFREDPRVESPACVRMQFSTISRSRHGPHAPMPFSRHLKRKE